MAEALREEEAASPNKYFDFGDDVDEEFETPPDSPDDVKMVLPAELEREIADTQLAEDYIKKNQESIAKSLESVRELQTTMMKLISQAEGRTSELKNRTVTLKTMKQEIDEISMEAIAKEEEELKKLIKTEAAHLNHIDGEPTNIDLAALKHQLEPYTESLSFSVDANKDWISCSFTNIDKNRPELTCTIKLAIKNGGTFKCVDCDPSSDQVTQLLTELNQHRDLHKFIVQLRQEFQALKNKEN